MEPCSVSSRSGLSTLRSCREHDIAAHEYKHTDIEHTHTKAHDVHMPTATSDGMSANGTYIIALSERGDEHRADGDGGEVGD